MLRYLFQKLFLMFFCSCTNTELINLNEGVKFIDVINNNKNYDYEKIKLSTSYTENNNKICLYIKNDTKIFRENPIDKKCPSEI